MQRSSNSLRDYLCIVKILLLPFAIIYGLVVQIRNFLFDRSILNAESFSNPVIIIGNLRVGGTGKTPITLWLAEKVLQAGHKTTIVSRGYKRKTSGYLVVEEPIDPEVYGDEPSLMKHRLPSLNVVVDENRSRAISRFSSDFPGAQVFILDDAMQHRRVEAGLLLLLTTYHDPFYKDYLLPVGMLREPRRESSRADVIIVTKCPPNLDIHTRRSIKERIAPFWHQKVVFSYEQIKGLKNLKNSDSLSIGALKQGQHLLIAGIADESQLLVFLNSNNISFKAKLYRDHHNYNHDDIETIHSLFNDIEDKEKYIVTTEKDAVKLNKWLENEKFAALPVYVLQHEVHIFPEDQTILEERIHDFIRSYN